MDFASKVEALRMQEKFDSTTIEGLVLQRRFQVGQRFDDGFVPTISFSEHGSSIPTSAFALANFTVADNFTDPTHAGIAAGNPNPPHIVDATATMFNTNICAHCVRMPALRPRTATTKHRKISDRFDTTQIIQHKIGRP